MSADPEQELLREILRWPTATEDREKYAALLESRGDPRGEFIRIQLQLHRCRYLQELPASELHDRERELIAAHGREWSREVAALVDDVRFYRGFVDHVTVDARTFIERAAEIYQVAPVSYLTLSGVRAVYRELFASRHLARIRAIDLGSNEIDDEIVEALASSRHLGKLIWLELSFNGITQQGVEALAASRQLPDLSYVKLTSNRVEDPADRPLEIDMHSKELSILEWGGTRLGYELEQKYGPLRWLHHRSSSDFFSVPSMDGVLPP